MKTRKILFLFTTLTSMSLCACGATTSSSSSSSSPNSSKATTTSSSSGQAQTTSLGPTTSAQTSQQSSHEASSMPTFDVNYVKLFLAKSKNKTNYTHAYAWINNGATAQDRLLGDWPGTALQSYDENWYCYDFDTQYTQFSVIFSVNGRSQDSQSGSVINGHGAYWYYNDTLVKNNTMPDLNPPSPSSSSNPDSSSAPASSSSEEGSSSQGGDVTPGDDLGNIFHAFDWSLNTIKNNLTTIKNAGYTAIQTSPLQRPKDYSDQWKSNSEWWKLYQPLSFDVPTSGTWLGTPSDLQSLTTAAHAQGLTIIVDIVANHMGGNGDTPDGNIYNYEREIYDNRSQTFRSNGACSNWYDRYEVTHKRMANDPGYPDLVTENPIVQTAVYDYLKQLIDCGVDGFRFDAAKHIETPYDDDSVKSDFWTKTAVKAEQYAATSKNKDIYMYGEILNETPNIPYNYYTTHGNEKLLDAVTDNTTGNSILSAIESGNSNNAAKSGYNSGLPAEQTVLWGESHDTYLNGDGSSRNSSQENVDKAYALVGARKGTRALYFARPNMGTDIGSGNTQNNNYKGSLISAVNKLKKDMAGNDERIRSDGSIAYVARFGNNGYGASIVNVSGSGSTTLTFSDLLDGTYKDLVTGATYTMTDHSITVNIGSTGATVIEKIS